MDVDIGSWLLLTSRPSDPSADWMSGAWKSFVGDEELGRRARSGVSIPEQMLIGIIFSSFCLHLTHPGGVQRV